MSLSTIDTCIFTNTIQFTNNVQYLTVVIRKPSCSSYPKIENEKDVFVFTNCHSFPQTYIIMVHDILIHGELRNF